MVGTTKQHVANAFGCSVSTVTLLTQRVQATGCVRDRPRPGEPRVTTTRPPKPRDRLSGVMGKYTHVLIF